MSSYNLLDGELVSRRVRRLEIGQVSHEGDVAVDGALPLRRQWTVPRAQLGPNVAASLQQVDVLLQGLSQCCIDIFDLTDLGPWVEPALL